MIEVGKHYPLTITGISHQGLGIGRIESIVVFVPQVLIGEDIMVEITTVKRNLAEGIMVEMLTPSLERLTPQCAQSALCGGCELQHCSYGYQLAAKRQIVQDAMTKLARVEVDVLPTLGMDEPWRYRNKGVFHADYSKGQVTLGFYQQGTHQCIAAQECQLFSVAVNQLLAWLEEAIVQSGKANYIQKIMIRESRANGQLMVVFVTQDNTWRLATLVENLQQAQPLVTSVYHNINTNPKLMLGKAFQLLAGQPYLLDQIGALTFQISPQSFFQVNNAQANVLYQQALHYADLHGHETVVDAYCGIGTISLYLAQQAQQVYGVESVFQAIQDANINAQLNGVTNCKFITAKAEEWLPKWIAKGHKADVIVVDPPRKGCDTQMLHAIAASQAPRVVYISCSPSTLARDVKYLTENGYIVQKVQPVDLFGQGWHVECVVLMTYCGDKPKK